MAWKHVQHPMYEVRNAKGHSNVLNGALAKSVWNAKLWRST